MSKTKQFLTLLKFQFTINPGLWFLPLIFPFTIITHSLLLNWFGKPYPSIPDDLAVPSGLFVFIGIVGSILMSPEKIMLGGSNPSSNHYGIEFLLTRAIDRLVFYRVKSILLYYLLLIFPLLSIFCSLINPDLIVTVNSKTEQQACLAHVSGRVFMSGESQRLPNLISIPGGNILVTECRFGTLLIMVIAVQILLALSFKYGKFVFWTLLFFGLFCTSLFEHIPLGALPFYEKLFFSFIAHQALFWILTALVFIFAQPWCERRFTQLEQ